MKYLLDTNICIRFINGRSQVLRDRFYQVDDRHLSVSSITKAEMFYGSAKSTLAEQSRAVQLEFFDRFRTFDFDTSAAEVYGPLRAALEKKGTPIGQHDMLIAAIAVSRNLILVTHNVREFSRIDGLEIEDWEVD